MKTGRKHRFESPALRYLYDRFLGDDPVKRALYEEELSRASVARAIYDLRKRAGLSQKELADLVGTTASVISRLEDADYSGHSLTMLRRIAEALDRTLEIRFVAQKKASPRRRQQTTDRVAARKTTAKQRHARRPRKVSPGTR